MTKKMKKILDHIQYYMQLYKEIDALGKMVTLSLLDHSFSKNDITTFNCTKYRIDLAKKWKHSDQGKGLRIPEKKNFYRAFSGGMLQDVAYGVTKIKHDSG